MYKPHIQFSIREEKFDELWRNVNSLELEGLSAGPKSEAFETGQFLELISWAQAELNIAFDLVDGLLAGKNLHVVQVSKHSKGTSKQSSQGLKTCARIRCNEAKHFFQEAKENFRRTETCQALTEIARDGWPLVKIGRQWFANYGHEALFNLPLDEHKIALIRMDGSLEAVSYVFPEETRRKLLISVGDISGCGFCLSDHLKGELWKARIESLDRALLETVSTQLRPYASFDPSLTDKFSIAVGDTTVNFSLIDQAESIMSDRASTEFSCRLYKSFLASRGVSVSIK